ncbi:conserved hypothetical protein, partial [Trichinella spiralis]|uniref:hypothetical protein n=1 Tax=Trichinella spiralis TaxID=6334 RepID=UPI0001EFD689
MPPRRRTRQSCHCPPCEPEYRPDEKVIHSKSSKSSIETSHCPSGRRRLIKFLSQCTSTAQHFLVRVSTLVATGCSKLFPDSLEPRSTVRSSGKTYWNLSDASRSNAITPAS